MSSGTLYDKLENANARKEVRLKVGEWVLDRPESIPELLTHCFSIHNEISYKAAWILEIVCLEKLELLYPYLDSYFEDLPKVYKDQALRPMAKICEMLAVANYKKKDSELKHLFSAYHKETMISCCFDWLITDQKVACEVYAMSALYYLGTEIDWIHTELKTVIESNINESTAAYKARGKRVLKWIAKFRYIS